MSTLHALELSASRVGQEWRQEDHIELSRRLRGYRDMAAQIARELKAAIDVMGEK